MSYLKPKPAVEVLDDAIALAGGVFEVFAVQDLDGAAQVFNQSGILQGSGCQAYAGRPVPSICARNS